MVIRVITLTFQSLSRMHLVKYIYIITFILLLGVEMLYSQADFAVEDTSGVNILYRKELTGGVVLHNLGMGGIIRKGQNRDFFNSRILEIELVSMKHPKQIRVVNPYYFNAKSYVYGKLNHVYMLRAGYGNKKLLNRKPYWGGIELRLTYLGGASIAFAKPVYLYFWNDSYTVIKEEKYNPDNFYHSSEYIFGRAPYFSGISETRIYPGIYGKAGLNFEFGVIDTKIKAFEAGIIGEFFPMEIPIMAFNPAQNFFLTFYLSFQFGKRYNN